MAIAMRHTEEIVARNVMDSCPYCGLSIDAAQQCIRNGQRMGDCLDIPVPEIEMVEDSGVVIHLASRVGACEEDLAGTVLLDDPNLPFTFTDRGGVYYGESGAEAASIEDIVAQNVMHQVASLAQTSGGYLIDETLKIRAAQVKAGLADSMNQTWQEAISKVMANFVWPQPDLLAITRDVARGG